MNLTKLDSKKEKAAAAKEGQLDFLFDGKVYPTGMTKAKVKKMEEDRKKAVEKVQQPTNTGLGKDLLNKENPIK